MIPSRKNIIVIVILFIIGFSCNSSNYIDLENISLEWSDGVVRTAANNHDSTLKVFFFISPDCPLCINYVPTLSEFQKYFDSSGVKFFIVYPGEYNTKEDIRKFETRYDVQIPSMLDSKNKVASALGATITPSVFLMNLRGEIAYSGAIDNRSYETGKKRQIITEQYLKHAIDALLQDEHFNSPPTEAIGCVIEF